MGDKLSEGTLIRLMRSDGLGAEFLGDNQRECFDSGLIGFLAMNGIVFCRVSGFG